jgi:hypothetical protein
MRIWDISPHRLCRQHLLGEHRELHGIYRIITEGRHSSHPETRRWYGKAPALWVRHGLLVDEMIRRGYNHSSDLPDPPEGELYQREFVNSEEEQYEILRSKECQCITTHV